MELRADVPLEVAVERLSTRGREALAEGVWCRTRGAQLRCSIAATSSFRARPHFRGGVEQDGQAVVVRGAVRESVLEPLLDWTVLCAGVLLLVVSLALLLEEQLDVVGLVICAVAGVVLLAIGLRLRQRRAATFEADATELERSMARLLDGTDGTPLR